MRLPCWLLALTLLTSACAVEKKGILVDVEPGTPMDESDLHQHCDLGDNAACVLADAEHHPAPAQSLSILQGLAPPDRAVFAALIPKGLKLSWYVYDRDLTQLTKLFTVLPVSRGTSHWALQRLDARGLTPGHSYELLAGDPEGRLVETRKFRPLENDASALRAVVIGGWRLANHSERIRMIAALEERKPQFLVMAGSSSITTPSAELKGKAARDYFFEREAEARATSELSFERSLIPVATLWNDDEFGHANGDRSFPLRDQSREMHEIFFPHWADETSIVDGPGISLALGLRSQTLAFLDDLTFRQPPSLGEPVCHKTKSKKEVCKPGKEIPAPPGTRYGEIQANWISDRAGKSASPLWLLADGPNLLQYRPDWFHEPALSHPDLTHAPRAPWLYLLHSGNGLSLEKIY
ncbi:MAG: hypothetical protein ACXVB9_15770 [Bdellovibrionota bacterium]